MKRPQGIDTTTARRAVHGRPDAARQEDRNPQPKAGDPARTAASSSAGVDRSESEPVTAPIPVQAAPRPARTAKTSIQAPEPTGRSGAAVARSKAGEREVAAPREPATSVRSAHRERKRYEHAEIKRFTRAARRRRMAWLIGVGSAVIVLLGAALVSFSPVMALRTVDVVGAHRVNASAVSTALDGQLGTPLPLLDYADMRRELGRFPLIRSYSTRLEPPGTLVVRIVERTPLAVLTASAGFQLVDQAGVVMQTTPTRPGGYPLIVLPGDASKHTRQTEFEATAAVLAALPDGMLAKVATASATGTEDVTLKLASGVSVVWGGPNDAALKSSVLASLVKAAPHASVYDVSAPNSPVIR